MNDKKNEFKKKLHKAKQICEQECDILYLSKDIDLTYDHYCSEVHTVFLRESPETVNRVTHASVAHIAKRLKEEVGDRWNLGLLVTRPAVSYTHLTLPTTPYV